MGFSIFNFWKWAAFPTAMQKNKRQINRFFNNRKVNYHKNTKKQIQAGTKASMQIYLLQPGGVTPLVLGIRTLNKCLPRMFLSRMRLPSETGRSLFHSMKNRWFPIQIDCAIIRTKETLFSAQEILNKCFVQRKGFLFHDTDN